MRYTIHYWDIDSRNRTTSKNLSTDGVQISHVFSNGFDEFKTYNIVVTASTIAGQGSDSQIFVLKGKIPPKSTQHIIAGIILYRLV